LLSNEVDLDDGADGEGDATDQLQLAVLSVVKTKLVRGVDRERAFYGDEQDWDPDDRRSRGGVHGGHHDGEVEDVGSYDQPRGEEGVFDDGADSLLFFAVE